jgi:ankyrin repeat protein
MESSMRLASFCFMQVRIPTIGKHILRSTKKQRKVTFDRPISSYDNSPKIKAWDFILQGGLPREVVETLSCLTQGSDFIDEQNYTQTHKIVLGLSMNSLEEEIIKHPEDVNAVDALGRTPLTWAAARGNEHFVTLLLGAGADPNILDMQWTGGVSYAAERDHTACVRLMLEAGAEPDPVLPDGIMVGSALNCASRNASQPLVMKTLLDFGADVESSGVECITSLIHAARTNKASFAMMLLEYGADVNATSTLGQTPLTTAIAYNSHDVLQLLLERWFEYSECPRLKGPHLLEIAAIYADVKTINILTNTNHFMLNYDRSYAAGNFATQLRERSDATEKLVTAFESLLDVICKEPDLAVSTPNLMEAGLLSCPVSEKGGSDATSDHPDSESSFDDAVEQL